MTEQIFLDKMVEIMDTESSLAMDTCLENIEEWDSLSQVTFLALCKEEGRKIRIEDVIAARIVGDLYRFVAP